MKYTHWYGNTAEVAWWAPLDGPGCLDTRTQRDMLVCSVPIRPSLCVRLPWIRVADLHSFVSPYCMCCAECGRAAAAGRRQAPDDERPGTTSDSIVECRYTSPVSLLACSFSQVRFLLCLSISSSLNALTRAELCMSFFSPYSWVLQFIYSSIDMLYL